MKHATHPSFVGPAVLFDELFTPEDIGCKLESLWNASLDYGDYKITKRCVIYKEKLHRKAHKTKK